MTPLVLLLALLCGLAYTGFNISEKYMGMTQVNPVVGATGMHIVGMVMSVIIMLAYYVVVKPQTSELSVNTFQAKFIIAAGVSVAFLDLFLVIAYFKGAQMGLFIGLVQIQAVVFGAIVGWAVLGERYTPVQIVGIVGGAHLGRLPHVRRRQPAQRGRQPCDRAAGWCGWERQVKQTS